ALCLAGVVGGEDLDVVGVARRARLEADGDVQRDAASRRTIDGRVREVDGGGVALEPVRPAGGEARAGLAGLRVYDAERAERAGDILEAEPERGLFVVEEAELERVERAPAARRRHRPRQAVADPLAHVRGGLGG